MTLRVRRLQVWSAEIPNQPGAAAGKLEALNQAGVELELLFTRLHPSRPEDGILYVGPLQGAAQTEAARKAGLSLDRDMTMLCVEGDNRPGLGYEIMRLLAIAGINVRSLTISSTPDHLAAYLALDSADAATLAIQLLATLH